MLPIFSKRELRFIGKAYRRIDDVLRWSDRDFYWTADTLSLWSTAQHLEHVAKVNLACFQNILTLYFNESPEILTKGSPTWAGWAVLVSGRIPVGRGKSPAAFVPPLDVDRSQVVATIRQSKQEMAKVANRAESFITLRGRLPHPMLGAFDTLQWLRFTRIHMEHHLTIIEKLPTGAALHDKRTADE